MRSVCQMLAALMLAGSPVLAQKSTAPNQRIAAAPASLPTMPVMFNATTKSGAFAKYAVSDGASTSFLLWTYLGAEGSDHVFEFSTGGEKLPPGSTRFSATLDAKGRFSDIKNVVVQPVGGKAQRLTGGWAHAVKSFASPDPKQRIAREVIPVGQRQVSADRYRLSSASGVIDIWLSEEIAPIGVARMAFDFKSSGEKKAPQQFTISVAEVGDDGKSQITDEPEAAAVQSGKASKSK